MVSVVTRDNLVALSNEEWDLLLPPKDSVRPLWEASTFCNPIEHVLSAREPWLRDVTRRLQDTAGNIGAADILMVQEEARRGRAQQPVATASVDITGRPPSYRIAEEQFT